MAKRSVIGLAGSMSSGKSTAAKYMTDTHGFTEYAFANPLKDIAVKMGLEQHQVYGTQAQKLEVNKLWGVSGREFLQKFGTDICRDTLFNMFPNADLKRHSIWIKLFEKYLIDNPTGNIVVSDVRFADEANFITSLGGSIIKIERTTGVNGRGLQPGHSNYTAHKSETPIPECYVSYFLKNNGTLEDLYFNIDNAIKELL